MILQTSNEPPVTTVTHPFFVKRVDPIGPHRPSALAPASADSAVTASAARAASGLPTLTGMPVIREDGEEALILKIERLCGIHKEGVSNVANGQQKKRAVRAELGKHLSELKNIYASPGCKGQWLAALRRLGLHRSTAEGLINRHLAGGVAKKSALDVTELTEESIAKLLKALKSKLEPVNTRELVDLFVSQLLQVLNDQVAQRASTATIVDEGTRRDSPEVAKIAAFNNSVTIDDLDDL